MRPTPHAIRTTATCLLAAVVATVAATGAAAPSSPMAFDDVEETTETLMTNVSWVHERLETVESGGVAAVEVAAAEDALVFPANVTYNVTGGTVGEADVSGGHGTLTFEEAGQVKTVELGIRDDDLAEDDETVRLTLSSDDPHVTFGVRNHTHVVVDDDEANAPPKAPDAHLKVEAGSAVSATLPGSDPDGDDLFWTVTDGPHRGSLALDQATGEFNYAPDPGYVGGDAFAYRVTDGEFPATGHVEVSVLTTTDDSGISTDDGEPDTDEGAGDGGASAGDGAADGGSGTSSETAAAAEGAMWWLLVGTVALVACGGAVAYGHYRSQFP